MSFRKFFEEVNERWDIRQTWYQIALRKEAAINQGILYYHGTKNDYSAGEVATGQRMFGIHLTTDPKVAQDYGDVRAYQIAPSARFLNLSDGYDLWNWMIKNEILDQDDIQNPDLESYVVGGRLFQYDISSRTYFQNDIAKTVQTQGYDVVMLPDDLGSYEDNTAYVVVNPSVLTVAKLPADPKPSKPPAHPQPDVRLPAPKTASALTLYRGELASGQQGNYFTPDREWARQFTQSGRDHEIRRIRIDDTLIYRAPQLPEASGQEVASKIKLGTCRNEALINNLFGSVTDFAQIIEEKGDCFSHGNIIATYNPQTDIHTFWKIESLFDQTIAEAKRQGKKAIWVDEGQGQTNSVFIFDKSIIRTAAQRPPDYNMSQEEWDEMLPDEQQAHRYFWIGQDDDERTHLNYCWLWNGTKLLVAKGKTHPTNFGHEIIARSFRGWFDVDKKILSLVFPETLEWRNTPHNLAFIPPAIPKALYKRFGQNILIEVF